ncbi:hypothetical protein [Desulfosarcina cetonica]|uniref:hypothetical protein n=1 Tax=Desulfosarcina cetonica TaxID=90730 RepID=UPI0012EDF65B|nr:hypothetical protein [Desulfosarcina cetonica]
MSVSRRRSNSFDRRSAMVSVVCPNALRMVARKGSWWDADRLMRASFGSRIVGGTVSC